MKPSNPRSAKPTGRQSASTAPPGLVVAVWTALAGSSILQAAPPSAIVLHGGAVREQQPAGTIAGVLVAGDEDAGDSHIFALVAGEGGEDNGLFVIQGDTLRTAATFDYETRNAFRVRLRAQDAQGGTVEALVIVTVTHPKFAAALDRYFAANHAVAAHSIDTLRGDTRDYFHHCLHLLASAGRIPIAPPANLPPDHNVSGAATVALSSAEVARIHAAKAAHAIWLDLNRLVPWPLAD